MDNDKRRKRFLEDILRRQSRGLEDIIREHALPYLPAKSLARFKCVCRNWKHWISNPFFSHNQSHSFRSISGLFYQTDGGPKFLSINPNSSGIPDPSLGFLPDPVKIMASCNGLLCCQGIAGDNSAYYVCNPATKEWRALPNPTRDHGPSPALVLVFEPSLFNFAADFKLVCAFQASDIDDGHEFEIFSSESGEWRVSREICFCEEKVVPHSGVYANGVVYWTTSEHNILGFDLVKDRSRLIPLPIHYYNSESGRGRLGELCGQICFVYASWANVTVHTLEKTFSDTWSSKCSFSLSNVTGRTVDLVHSNRTWPLPLPFQGGGGDVIFRMEEKILSYNIITKTETMLCCMSASEPVFLASTACVPYINSLVSVKK